MAWHGLQVRVCVFKVLPVFAVPVTLCWSLAPPPGNVVGLSNFTAEQQRHGFYVEGVDFHPEKQKYSNPSSSHSDQATTKTTRSTHVKMDLDCLAPKENKSVIFHVEAFMTHDTCCIN